MKSIIFASALASSVSAFTINFVNNCQQTVWPAVGQAPNGIPTPAGAFGQQLNAGQSTSFVVDDQALGVRAWGRTGCDATGANCQTGACVGGLVCTDGGITSGVLLAEFGFANFGQFGGLQTAWDLSLVDASLNLDTRLTSSDGKTVTCTSASCAPDQAFNNPTDFQANRNSPIGISYTHTFCP